MARGPDVRDHEDCRRFAKTPPEKIGVADKPFWLHCAMEAGGMGNRGR